MRLMRDLKLKAGHVFIHQVANNYPVLLHMNVGLTLPSTKIVDRIR